MRYYAEQGDDDGFWYVREEGERIRPAMCRAESVVLIADRWPDGGERAAKAIADMLNKDNPDD